MLPFSSIVESVRGDNGNAIQVALTFPLFFFLLFSSFFPCFWRETP